MLQRTRVSLREGRFPNFSSCASGQGPDVETEPQSEWSVSVWLCVRLCPCACGVCIAVGLCLVSVCFCLPGSLPVCDTPRLKGKMSKPKFALQLYSRLTNANPELVLVFMQAGSKVCERKGAPGVGGEGRE